ETGQRTSTNAKASSDNKKAKKDTSRKRATTGPSRFFLPRSTMSDSDDSVDYDPNPIPGFDSFTGLPKRISGPKKVTQNTVAGTAAASAAGFLVMGPVGAVIAGGSAFTVLKRPKLHQTPWTHTGDLNYRVALDYHIPEAVGWSHEKKWAHVTQMVKDGKSKELLAYDELIHEHAAMRVFGNFQEGVWASLKPKT
ncbi:hypothetical protein SARC_11973, partial [Sphaeroforma arctica JP610]